MHVIKAIPSGEAVRSMGSRSGSAPCDERSRARQDNANLGVPAGLAIDLYKPRMLLDDDVVSDGQTKASTLSGGLCGEEGIEHLFPDLGRNAASVITNPDLYVVAKILGCSNQHRLMFVPCRLRLPLRRRVKAV